MWESTHLRNWTSRVQICVRQPVSEDLLELDDVQTLNALGGDSGLDLADLGTQSVVCGLVGLGGRTAEPVHARFFMSEMDSGVGSQECESFFECVLAMVVLDGLVKVVEPAQQFLVLGINLRNPGRHRLLVPGNGHLDHLM